MEINTHYLDDPYFDKAEDDTESDYVRFSIMGVFILLLIASYVYLLIRDNQNDAYMLRTSSFIAFWHQDIHSHRMVWMSEEEGYTIIDAANDPYIYKRTH